MGLVIFRDLLPLHLYTVFFLKLLADKSPEIVEKLCEIVVNIHKITFLDSPFYRIVYALIDFHYFIRALFVPVNLKLKRL